MMIVTWPVGTQSTHIANTQQLIKEQHEDKSSLAKRDKAGYFVWDGILYQEEKKSSVWSVYQVIISILPAHLLAFLASL